MNCSVFIFNLESTEDDQIKIDQLTRELVDIVEQRNSLVELLEQDRKRCVDRWLEFMFSPS